MIILQILFLASLTSLTLTLLPPSLTLSLLPFPSISTDNYSFPAQTFMPFYPPSHYPPGEEGREGREPYQPTPVMWEGHFTGYIYI